MPTGARTSSPTSAFSPYPAVIGYFIPRAAFSGGEVRIIPYVHRCPQIPGGKCQVLKNSFTTLHSGGAPSGPHTVGLVWATDWWLILDWVPYTKGKFTDDETDPLHTPLVSTGAALLPC
uniref:Uncharacterized protein n=1 Tax=Ursus americanus TaxID=9643 RepID=A0A452QXI2_URSAM